MAESRNGDAEELLLKLDAIGDRGWFLWKIFLLCMIPSVLNGLNLTSYIYLAQVPQHWCAVPELRRANWTGDQIRTVSSPDSDKSSCSYYDWDYELLATLGYEKALEYQKGHERPVLKPCSGYSYPEGADSMVVDYDLVCERIALKSTIQVALSLGKFLGAFFFGVISDKYGRRLSFLMGSILYVVSGPLIVWARNYGMVIAGRVGLGAAGSGIYHSAYVILSEIASKKRRATLGILYNMSYPIGQMVVPLIAYFVTDWRLLQLTISAPALLTLGFYWLIPESPRWLISMGKKQEAARIINGVYREGMGSQMEAKIRLKEDLKMADDSGERRRGAGHGDDAAPKVQSDAFFRNIWLKLKSTMSQMFELVRYSEMRNRLFITLFTWCVCSLSYYALALNVDNFHSDRYIYGFLTGLVEVPSYLLPLPFLKYLGRRQTAIILFYVGGLALMAILGIPRGEEYGLLTLIVASVGRLCASGVFAVVILHTGELFPTLIRNTAIGSGSTAAHVGSMSAPFLVDLLGAYAWFIPSTVCGITTLLAGTLIFLLPETKNKRLPDTVQDILDSPREDRIGCHHICGR